MNQYLKQYQKNQIATASQEQILIMLYNGAIQFLNIAKKAMEEKNIQETHNNIIKAQRIITEFKATLDMEMGGELAQNLFSLYTYLNKRLVQANLEKDVNALDEVLHHLKDLRNTWVEAIKIAGKEQKEQEDVQAEKNEEQPSEYESRDFSG